LRDRATGPWLATTVVVDPRSAPAIRVQAIRDAIRPLLEPAAA